MLQNVLTEFKAHAQNDLNLAQLCMCAAPLCLKREFLVILITQYHSCFVLFGEDLWETDSYKSLTFFLNPSWNMFMLISIVQSTLVISNSKGLSEILRDIRSSTYQVCRIEEKIIWLTTFNKLIGNWTFEVRDILKILWKRGEIAP